MTDITKLLDEHPLPWKSARPPMSGGPFAIYDSNGGHVCGQYTPDAIVALANALHAEQQNARKAIEEACHLRAAIHSLPDFYDDDGEPTYGTGRIEAVKRQLEEWKRYKRNVEERQKRDQNEIDALKHRLNRDMPVYVDEPYKIPPLNDSGDVDALRYRVGELEESRQRDRDMLTSQVKWIAERLGDLERIVRDGDRLEAIEKRLDAIGYAANSYWALVDPEDDSAARYSVEVYMAHRYLRAIANAALGDES